MGSRSAPAWRRRKLDDVAESAVSRHRASLYSLYQLRWDDGRQRIVAELRAVGYPGGAHIDTLLDLETGEEFQLSSDDGTVAARRLTVNDLPQALREAWPRDDRGRPIPPGLRERGPVVRPDQLRQLARHALELRPGTQLALFR